VGVETSVEIPSHVELRRLHPLTPVMRSWRLVGLAGALGFGVFRDELDKLRWLWDAAHGDVQASVLVKGFLVVAAVATVSVAAAWLSWRVTGFAIVRDSSGVSTLLYHRGLVVKQRRQVRLNRVQAVDVNQPLGPRLFGLASVRLDMAAGDEASVDLAYLRQSDAWVLREEILRHTSAGVTHLTEERVERRPDTLVAEVSTQHVVYANLLDGIGTWIFGVVWIVAIIATFFVWGDQVVLAALSGVVAITLAIFAQTRRQVMSMLRDANFRLYRTPTGIRVSSGLTSTTNRTIEFDRIQGVRIEEPLLWRRFGWARVLVDVAGAKGDGENAASLMPVADRAVALHLVADVTGADLEASGFSAGGRRARLLDPWGWRFLGVALLEHGAVARAGRWRRKTSYVPFARVQSVSARQGFVQRRLGLTTVHLDVAKGAQRWTAPHRDAGGAAELVTALGAQARQHRLSEAGSA
jgi:putative membrane protein